jgi:hypothetical protein
MTLHDLIRKYADGGGVAVPDYRSELAAARTKAEDESKVYNDLIQKHITSGESPESKSEMWFKLAAALGAPTRTGSFGETLGNAAGALGEYKKDARAEAVNKLQLALDAQKMKTQSARDNVTSIRDMYKLYQDENKPTSPIGKVLEDLGIPKNSPEYAAKYQSLYDADQAQKAEYKAAQISNLYERPREQYVTVFDENNNPVHVPASQSGGMTAVTAGMITPQQEQKQFQTASKDLQLLESNALQTEALKQNAEELSKHKGLSGISGLTGKLPSFSGSSASQATNVYNNLKGKITALAKESAASSGAIGSMATQEWGMLARQFADIDPVLLGEEETKVKLNDLMDKADTITNKLKSEYAREHEHLITNPKYTERLTPVYDFKPKEPDSANWPMKVDSKGRKAKVNPNNRNDFVRIH